MFLVPTTHLSPYLWDAETSSGLTLLRLSPAARCSLLLFMATGPPDHRQLSVPWLSPGLDLGQAGGARGDDALHPSSSQQMKNGSQENPGSLVPLRPLAGLALCLQRYPAHLCTNTCISFLPFPCLISSWDYSQELGTSLKSLSQFCSQGMQTKRASLTEDRQDRLSGVGI